MQWDELFSEVRDYQPGQDELDLPTGGGVYLLADEQDRMIQLASAADLRRAIQNRLSRPESSSPVAATVETTPSAPAVVDESPPDQDATSASSAGQSVSRRRADLSQIVRRIRWQPTHSVFEATFVYYRIARALMPDDYLDNVAFGPAWFVHADVDAPIPRFNVSKRLSANAFAAGQLLGPFATQSDASRFVQTLEDVFDLCRYVHILEQAPHGNACAYFEMGRCPAPCDGSIPMSAYRDTMSKAVRFAAGQREEVRREWDQLMHAAAKGLEFETAAAIKQRIERARELEQQTFRYVRPVEQFSWLIVQRAGGRTRVKPFFVQRGWIQPGEAVRLKDLEQTVPTWIERMRPEQPMPGLPPTDQLSEHIWLVSHFLFRRERVGLFLRADELPEATGLCERVRSAFEPAKTERAEQAGDQPLGQ